MPGTFNSETARTVGTLILALAIFGGSVAAIPWADKKDVEDLQEQLTATITLFNQNSKWYGEMEVDNAGMKKDLEHVKEDMNEMKADLKDIKKMIQGMRR